MKTISLFLIFLTVLSCKEGNKPLNKDVKTEIENVAVKLSYPAELEKVLEAHGGIENWKEQKTLTFNKPTPEVTEAYTVDLQSRKEKVVVGTVERGFDGENVWVLDPENQFKGDAIFYKNLYFYFYAMPFVLADSGINYSEVENLEVDGASYPGVKITFGEGVGTSPKDEYFLYYDATTYQMVWLGYTVTYRTGEKSDKISWIQYDNWEDVSGVKLPKSISWHKSEGNNIMGIAKTVLFENVTLSKKEMGDSYYAKPESATIAKKKSN
ncbi:hypothetical protein H0I23_08425 [Cellulophaga sp. HaHaR_3_176]|uniref:DUF6503 family protein n=1 Tax=Cellulophaga sp. HaHaR_3_176 TaxID=1942464 RepID=UPI001C1F378A|nr:DUF6503 family protein [Cellulophaga sp. HaHaR_3_176]QWX82503.1 hypothetical protein H0I23_08425 [Cellulophaga sp. HaHaR_3_176]